MKQKQLTSLIRYEGGISLCLVSIISSSSSTEEHACAHYIRAGLRDRNCNLTLEKSCTMRAVPPRAGRAEVHLSALLRKRSRLHARWARRPAVTSPSPRAARVRTADSHTTLQRCSSSTTLPLPPSIHPHKCQPQTFTPQSLELNWAPAARAKNVAVPFWKKKKKKHGNVSNQRFYTLHQIMIRLHVLFLPEGDRGVTATRHHCSLVCSRPDDEGGIYMRC